MLVNGLKTEFLKFENLEELLKINPSHYILKYALEDEGNMAIYYTMIDSINYVLLVYCFDNNVNTHHLKISAGHAEPCSDVCTNSRVVVSVEYDSFLEAFLKEEYGSEKETKKKCK